MFPASRSENSFDKTISDIFARIHVDFRAKKSDKKSHRGDRFIAELREEARRRNLAFRIEKDRGKGGHSMIWVGPDKVTTVPAREIDPKTARKIRKALGLD
jgi:hypothetical protein